MNIVLYRLFGNVSIGEREGRRELRSFLFLLGVLDSQFLSMSFVGLMFILSLCIRYNSDRLFDCQRLKRVGFCTMGEDR